jgi:hypothetical protein
LHMIPYFPVFNLVPVLIDAFSQWRQTGNVDWKKNGKRAAVVALLTIPLIGAGMFAGTKAKIFGDDAPVISRSIQNNDVHVSINKPKADGGDVKTDVDVPGFKEPVAGDSTGVNLRGEGTVRDKGSNETNLRNIDDFINGNKKFEVVIEDYAKIYKEHVDLNRPWSWDDTIPGGDSLSSAQKRKIKEMAIEKGHIPQIKVKKQMV